MQHTPETRCWSGRKIPGICGHLAELANTRVTTDTSIHAQVHTTQHTVHQFLKVVATEPGVVQHTCSVSIQDAEAGELRVQGQARLHSEELSQRTKY